MTVALCATGCGTPSPEAMICAACTRDLEQALAELPADLEDLQRAATLQTAAPLGLGDPHRQWNPRTAEPSKLPARLRSVHGPIALPTTAWPFAPGAADLLWAARNTLGTWARHLIADMTWLDHPGRPTRGLAPTARMADNVPGWLLGSLEAIRRDEAAAELHDEITYLRAAIGLAILGRVGTEDYYGRCDAPDVRVSPLRIEGPPCTTLVCAHLTCAIIRGERVILAPRVGRCGAELYAPPDEVTVKCRACGRSYDAKTRKADLRDMLPDRIATIREVADGLTKLDQRVTVDMITHWVKRGKVPGRGNNPSGYQLVRVGDVQDHLEALAEERRRKTPRRKITAA